MLVSAVQQRVAPNNRVGQVGLNQNKSDLSKTNQNPAFGDGLETFGKIFGGILKTFPYWFGTLLVVGTIAAFNLLDNSGTP